MADRQAIRADILARPALTARRASRTISSWPSLRPITASPTASSRHAGHGRRLGRDAARQPLPRRRTVTAEKMKRLGIETGADLRAKSAGVPAAAFRQFRRLVLRHRAREDDRPVNPNRVRKSSGSETTFNRDLTNPLRSRRRASHGRRRVGLVRVTASLRPHRHGEGQIRRFHQITRRRSQPRGGHQSRRPAPRGARPYPSVLPTQKGIRLVGVTVSNFVEAGAATPTELPIFAEAAA